jgi:HEAT repeat protein
MRSLSPDTRVLIERLREPVSLRERLLGTGPDLPALLRRIAAAGEPAAVPFLVSFLLDRREEVASAAASALGQLVGAIYPADLSWLDERIRVGSAPWYALSSEWCRLRPEQVCRLQRLPGGAAAVGLASCHASGYVRQAAVECLASVTDGSELPFLLIRLNDWVEPVRRSARRALRSRVTPEYAGHFVRNLPLVLRLKETRRADHASFVTEVIDLLKSPSCLPALWDGIRSPDRRVARSCFRIAGELEGEALRPVIDFGLRARDPLIRLWAARWVAAAFEGAARREFLERIKRDRFVPVRREALRAYAEREPELAPAELRRALLDPHPSVRAVARYFLRQVAPEEFAPFYREALARAEGAGVVTALMGLAETGAAADAALACPYLASPAATIRQAALRCLARLDPDTYLPTIVEAMRDDAPSVVREARETLSVRASRVDTEWLWSLFRGDRRRHVRNAALSLIACLGKWERIAYLVRAARDEDPEVASDGQRYLTSWIGGYNQSFTLPMAEQLDRLALALESATGILDPALVQTLNRFHSLGAELLRPGRRRPPASGRPSQGEE